MNIITRGLGKQQSFITRGFGSFANIITEGVKIAKDYFFGLAPVQIALSMMKRDHNVTIPELDSELKVRDRTFNFKKNN